MSFGGRLKRLREELDLTRAELAEKIGIKYYTLSKYETDERFPDKETLIMLSDYFNVSLDFLLGKTDIRNQKEEDILKDILNSIAKALRDKGAIGSDEDLSKEAMELLLKYGLDAGSEIIAARKKKQED